LDINLASMQLFVTVLHDFFPRDAKNLWLQLQLLAVVPAGAQS
jgi:hypothetical protein